MSLLHRGKVNPYASIEKRTFGSAQSGTLVWTCTADEGKKATTILPPLVAKGDLDKKIPAREWVKHRLVKSAAEQNGLLTIDSLPGMRGELS